MSALRYANESAGRKDFRRYLRAAFDSQVVTVKVFDRTVAVMDAGVLRG